MLRTYAHAEHIVNSTFSGRIGTERAKHPLPCRRGIGSESAGLNFIVAEELNMADRQDNQSDGHERLIEPRLGAELAQWRIERLVERLVA